MEAQKHPNNRKKPAWNLTPVHILWNHVVKIFVEKCKMLNKWHRPDTIGPKIFEDIAAFDIALIISRSVRFIWSAVFFIWSL